MGGIELYLFYPKQNYKQLHCVLKSILYATLISSCRMSSRYALAKRTYGQYIFERIKRLLIPLVFGVVCFCPVLAYFGDKNNYGYSGGFFEHYGVFFTKWTDLTGFDGGFNVGQFWFLLYLFIISLLFIGIIAITNRVIKRQGRMENIPFGAICLMVIPLSFLYDLLSIDGKSFAEYIYIFLIGFYVLSHDKVIAKIEKYRYISLTVGLVAAITNVYMFIWSGNDLGILNVIAKAFAEWFMILTLIGIGKNKLDFRNRILYRLLHHIKVLVSLKFMKISFFVEHIGYPTLHIL
jgi:glucan biosynthesis protein C